MKSKHFATLALLVGLVVFGTPTYGAVFTLTGGVNSTVNFNDTTNPNGVVDWIVAGTDQMFQQYFWYRLGSTGAEAPISALGAGVVTQTDPSTATVTYTLPGVMAISVKYSLTGSNANPLSSFSDLGEQITIENLSASSSLDMHFFQYSDFDLGGTANNDQLSFTGTPINTAIQTDAAGAQELSETVVARAPNEFSGDYFANILNSLNDGTPTTLDNTNHVTSPGDATWAFEWDQPIGPGGVFGISKDKLLNSPGFFGAPEPSSFAVWGLLGASLSIGAFRRRRAS